MNHHLVPQLIIIHVIIQTVILHDIVGVMKTALPPAIFNQEPNHHYSEQVMHVMQWDAEVIIPLLEYLNGHKSLPLITPLSTLDHIPASCCHNPIDVMALACLELTAWLNCQSHEYIATFIGQDYTGEFNIHQDIALMLNLMEALCFHSVEAQLAWQHHKNSH